MNCNQQKEMTMTEFNKRYSDAHKSALSMVKRHVGLAQSAHRRGMSSIAECAKGLVEANKLGKAADSDRLARHLTVANGHFEKAADELSDAQAHLNQALSHFSPDEFPLLVPSGYSRSSNDRPARSVAGATAVTPSLSDMTEGGDVPQYDSVMPRPTGKVAAAFAKMMTGEAPGRHVIGKPQLWANFSARR
jgi:hypothetical protein